MNRWSGRILPLKGNGYTMVEVMIVLSITAVMFVAVALSFNGRRGRTEFTQAVRDFEAKLQTTIGEVANGAYSPGQCSAPVSSGPPVIGGSGNSGRCVFNGKAYTGYGTPTTSSTISTLVGRRQSGNPERDVVTIAESQPVVATSSSEQYNHSFQMRVTKIASLASGNPRVYAFGFMVPFAGAVSLQADQSVGTKQVSLYGLVGSSSLTTSGNVVNTTNFVPMSSGIVICLRGQNEQRAELRIGAADSQSLIFSELDTPETGVCA